MTGRMTTRAKNVTQRPGLIDINPPDICDAEPSVVKRRSKAQKTADDAKKAADDQKEEEAAQARRSKTQEGYKRIAEFELGMKKSQDNQRMDAPKPRRPQPRAVAKSGKNKAVNQAAEGEDQAANDIEAVSAATQDVVSAMDDEGVPVAKNKGKLVGKGKGKMKAPPKPLKTPVRDSINAAYAPVNHNVIDAPRDKSKEPSDVPTTSKKYELIGRVDSWTADVDSSDPDAELDDSHPTSSSIFPTTTTSASSLSKGTIISDRNGPPPTPINKSAEHGVNFRGPFDIEDTDGDDDALAEQLERQAALLRARKKQRVADLVSITPDSEDNGPKNIAVEQPLNMIVDTQDDITFNEGDNDAGFSGITGSKGDVGILHDEDDDDMTCEEDATLDRESVDGDSGSMALKPATEQDDNGSADLDDTAMSFDESELEPDAPPSTQPRAPRMKLSLAQASRPLKRKKLSEPVDSDSSSELV
ncbi:hypothetical protein BJ138DRAFT_1120561 [Hygrophoropsis aurantiaca]|uniref:Uncharacterized protein n=1 Tax=Hygrophoropsis aurantiaca TaxID=72124 RepID=A0ACB7ZQZ0_9AGAM|nr:hypothetical protein BJ138DRAFT_1120561 [Hygrophoropsis aurantiaca]